MFRADQAGDELRTASVLGCSVTAPKNTRRGHPHSLRVDLDQKDSQGASKYVISVADAVGLKRWLGVISLASCGR